jgi:MFS family permease
MPVSLLTPISGALGVSEGQAGQAITMSGLFAVLTSLFGNSLLARVDRRIVVVLYTGILAASSLAVALAPNFLGFMIGRALVGIAIGGFWSLSTAILARLATPSDLPRAITLLQGGTAFAIVIAAPVGALLGALVGWRGTIPDHGADRPHGPGLGTLGAAPIAGCHFHLAACDGPPATETRLRPRHGRDQPRLHGHELALDLHPAVS